MAININSTTVIDDNRIFRLANYSESVSTPSITSNTLTLDLQSSSVFKVSLDANITTLTLQNSPASASGTGSFILILTADGSARTINWPASFKWAGGIAPTLTSTNGKIDVFAFLTPDNGTSWLAFTSGQNF